MSAIDPSAVTPLNESDLRLSGLPTGTVTLLLAEVEGLTRLWQTQPEQMTTAVARLDRTVSEIVSAHHGVRPVDPGDGDGFVAAFARASDAVACALDLQLAPLAPVRLRIGVHAGEVQLRDETIYFGPTVNRAARLRDLAHGGQTVLSGTAADLVADHLGGGAWLVELGSHRLRDLPRLERVMQLCHPDLHNDFPPLPTQETAVGHHIRAQLTSFVGREAEMNRLVEVLTDNRLVTLTGAGGIGKTRLALQMAATMAGDFDGGAWHVDLAPITDPDLVAVAVIRTLGLGDQLGCSAIDVLVRFVGDRHMLVVLDNCEHLLDACAALVDALLSGCPAATLVATSREPIGLTGEVSWRVPSLSLADEAIKLFTDRARAVRPDFYLTEDNADTVVEICRRLDGVPLAIELAAARVRVMSLTEIRDSLQNGFRLLTGGARTAMPRQQTLQASVDWSHALLTESERVLFRRAAVFMGGFDLDAAQAIAGSSNAERYQVLDLLTLLVDKSLVVAESASGATRYRLLETIRQYAMERLSESGESDAVRSRHRDHYMTVAALLDSAGGIGHEHRVQQADDEIDNLRAAFTWCRDNSDTELAAQLASTLLRLWLERGRIREGRTWFDAVLADQAAQPIAVAVRARLLADDAILDIYAGGTDRMERACEALAVARELDDPALLAWALTACSGVALYDPEIAQPYLAEAIAVARSVDDKWRLGHILHQQAYGAIMAGDPIAAIAAAQEGRDLADAIGDRFVARACRWDLGVAQGMAADMSASVAQLREVIVDAEAARDALWRSLALSLRALMLTYHGDTATARASATAAIDDAMELGGIYPGLAYGALIAATLGEGDVAAADDAIAAGWQHVTVQPKMTAIWLVYRAYAAMASGDLAEARRWAADAVAATRGFHQALALTTRAGVAIAEGEPEQAYRDAHEALAIALRTKAYGCAADTFECLALLAIGAAGHTEAARFYGAAHALRQRAGQVRFEIFDAIHAAAMTALRDAMGDEDYDSAWAEGAMLSTEEAIAYAQRRRGKRKRPTSGWASLTPTECDVVRLVSEGLANNDIATRLFVSPRTVQTHLTHVYTKLGFSSRVQLVQEAARHN